MRRTITITAMALAVLLGGCGDAGDGGGEGEQPFDLTAFCADLASFIQDTPDDADPSGLLAAFRDLAATAPEDLRDDIDVVAAALERAAEDGPAEEATDELLAASGNLNAYVVDECRLDIDTGEQVEVTDRYSLTFGDGTRHTGRFECVVDVGDFGFEFRPTQFTDLHYRFDLDGSPALRAEEYMGTVELTRGDGATSTGPVTVDATFESTNRLPIGSGTFAGSYDGAAGSGTFAGEFACELLVIVE